MMLDNFTAKQKSSLAIGLLLFLILIIVLGFVVPIVTDYYANKSKIATLQNQMQRYATKAVSRESVIKQTAALKSNIMGSGIVNTQKSIPLVLADMQEKIKSAIITAGAELNSTQYMSQKSADGLIKLGISTSFSGKMEHLKNILYALESAKPYMIIEKIKIYGSGNERSSATGKIDAANKIYVFADIITYIPAVTE